MDRDELDRLLEEHKTWLADNSSGKRADLWRANLREANLLGADLREADLRDTCVLTFQFQRHQAICTGDRLVIGCLDKSLDEWVLHYEDIGKEHGYTDAQIKLYGEFIKMCDKARG